MLKTLGIVATVATLAVTYDQAGPPTLQTMVGNLMDRVGTLETENEQLREDWNILHKAVMDIEEIYMPRPLIKRYPDDNPHAGGTLERKLDIETGIVTRRVDAIAGQYAELKVLLLGTCRNIDVKDSGPIRTRSQ